VRIDGIGEVMQWGDWRRPVYEGCGHETRVNRTGRRLYEPEDVEREVRTYYGELLAVLLGRAPSRVRCSSTECDLIQNSCNSPAHALDR
jgi:hypothetical protein